jgi:hypothetical protein
MSYFSNIPNIEYDTKPIQYPFSESEYVVAKNFFRRYQVNPDVFSYAVYFKKYSVMEGEKIYDVAEKAYGDAFLDWVIILTNNIVNTQFDWPLSEYDLRKYCEKNYEDAYGTIKYYRTTDALIKKEDGTPVIKPGLIVDEAFYNSTYRYWDDDQVRAVAGNAISTPITIFEYEQEQNEKKREIFLLKPSYLESFLDDFRKTNLYKKSKDYISSTLKKTGV